MKNIFVLFYVVVGIPLFGLQTEMKPYELKPTGGCTGHAYEMLRVYMYGSSDNSSIDMKMPLTVTGHSEVKFGTLSMNNPGQTFVQISECFDGHGAMKDYLKVNYCDSEKSPTSRLVMQGSGISMALDQFKFKSLDRVTGNYVDLNNLIINSIPLDCK